MFRSLKLIIVIVLLSVSGAITAQNHNFRTSVTISESHLSQLNDVPSGNRSGTILYDQLTPITNGLVACHKTTEPGWTHMSCSAADDFSVPDGQSWQVQIVEVLGSYTFDLEGLITNFNVRFYSDDDGQPGNQITAFDNITSFSEESWGDWNDFVYQITLPEAISLNAGHYWMEVQPVLYSDQWFWYQYGEMTIGNEYHWRNPANGFGLGYTNFTPASITDPTAPSYNLTFRLIAPGQTNDLSALAVIEPHHSPDLTAQEAITVLVKNEGAVPVTGFNVSYSVNNGPVITENVDTLSVAGNLTGSYTFNETANLAEVGPHIIKSWTDLSTDPNPQNDTITTKIYQMGTIYPMVTSGHQILNICNATFTDANGLGTDFVICDSAITTIYPENEGDRIVIDFIEWDLTYHEITIFNGPDITSPVLWNWWDSYSGQQPGIITALNPSGAITILFDGAVSDHFTGWAAYISCITPQPDEFAVNSLTQNQINVHQGDAIQLKAEIQNIGSQTHEKLVTFKANGTIIAESYSGFVSPLDTAIITFLWEVPEGGDFLIEASIENDFNNYNNKSSIEFHAVDLNIPYSVMASGDTSEMYITWNNPSPESRSTLAYDDNNPEEYYSGGNTVLWIGNYFEINKPTTILSFDFSLSIDDNDDIRSLDLDIFNAEGLLLYRTKDFIDKGNHWYTAEMPDLTFNEDIYAMLYYNNTFEGGLYFLFDKDTVPGHGYLRYEGQGFGQMMGSFLMRANVLSGDSNGENLNYNIRFGNIEDIETALTWQLLNTSALAGNEYTDPTWPPSESGTYVYAICATDSTGESGFSFSNILQWDPVNALNHTIPGIRIYPNPSSDYLNIETSGESSLLIFNMQGNMLFSQEITTDLYTLKTSQFSKGTYLIVLRNANGLRQQKVIIQ